MTRRYLNGRAALVAAVLALGIGYVAAGLAAGIPTTETLVYSGLVQEDGLAPATPLTIAVSLFEADAGGAPLCRVELADPIAIESKGRFRVDLGVEPLCLAAVRAQPNLYVEVEARGLAISRTKLSASPYAVEAERASSVTAGAIDTTNLAEGAVTTTKLDPALDLPPNTTVRGLPLRSIAYWSTIQTGSVDSNVWTPIPGLQLTLDLAADATVSLRSGGSLRTPLTAASKCMSGFRYSIDGVALGGSQFGQAAQSASESAGWWHTWTLTYSASLTAGIHVIQIDTRSAGVSGFERCIPCGDIGSVPADNATCLFEAIAYYD